MIGLPGINIENRLQPGQAFLYIRQLFHAFMVGHQHPGPRIGQPVLQSIYPEQGKQGNRNRPQFVHGNVGNRRFHSLRQQNTHPVTLAYAGFLQHAGKLVRVLLKLVKGITTDIGGRFFMDQRQATAAIGPFIADIHSDIVIFRDIPFEFLIGLPIRWLLD
ncbi:hypothetical protein GCM10011450_13280 [Advenella faeciporci]|uniref:Uncharacterized protein n=1 Tax=Advenella faeciporci TaxID=797535 RepID=A0A918JJP2_9BURK|nr:hypothetical protein GCM10011450_13280 [Advenella faeciporci]